MVRESEAEVLEKRYQAEATKGKQIGKGKGAESEGRFAPAVLRMFKKKLLLSGFFQLLYTACLLINPLLLRELIKSLTTKSDEGLSSCPFSRALSPSRCCRDIVIFGAKALFPFTKAPMHPLYTY